MAPRKLYSREFKIEAVKLVPEQDLPRTHVARELGLDVGTLRRRRVRREPALIRERVS